MPCDILGSVEFSHGTKGWSTLSNYCISRYTHLRFILVEHQLELPRPISWNSVESGIECTLRIYSDSVTLTLHNLTLTSQKPCQYNNMFDCSETNGYKIPPDALNEV